MADPWEENLVVEDAPPWEQDLVVDRTQVTPPMTAYERASLDTSQPRPDISGARETPEEKAAQVQAVMGAPAAAFDAAGRAIRNVGGSQGFLMAGEPTLAAQQLGVPASLLKRFGAVTEPEDTGETPIEQGIRSLPVVPRVASQAVFSTAEQLPKLAATAAMPEAAGAIFGLTPQGTVDIKQAAIAQLLPFVGKWTGAATEAVASKLGVTTDQAGMLVNKLGGASGAAGILGADQLYAISKLPSDQRKDAWVDAVANTASMAGLGLLGGREAKVRAPERQGPMATGAVLEMPEGAKPPESGPAAATGGTIATQPPAELLSTAPAQPSMAEKISSPAEGKYFVVMQDSGAIHVFENLIAAEAFKIKQAESHGGKAELDGRVGKKGETVQDVLNSASRVVGKGKKFTPVFHTEKPEGNLIETDQPSVPTPAAAESVPTAPAAPAEQLGVWPSGEWSYDALKKQSLGARSEKAKYLGLRDAEGRLETGFRKLADAGEKRLAALREERARKAKPAPAETPAQVKARQLQERIAAGIEPKNVQITVSPAQTDQGRTIPGTEYVQVDEVHPEKGNVFSSNPEDLNKGGFRMPTSAELLTLPKGKYSLEEAQRLLTEKASAKLAATPDAEINAALKAKLAATLAKKPAEPAKAPEPTPDAESAAEDDRASAEADARAEAAAKGTVGNVAKAIKLVGKDELQRRAKLILKDNRNNEGEAMASAAAFTVDGTWREPKEQISVVPTSVKTVGDRATMHSLIRDPDGTLRIKTYRLQSGELVNEETFKTEKEAQEKLDFYKMLGGHTEDRIAATSSESSPLPNKATQYSITKALQAAKIIRGPVRKHAFENAYASLRLHAQKLGIDVGKLGTYFNADEYRRLAGETEIAIGKKYGTHPTAEMRAAKEATAPAKAKPAVAPDNGRVIYRIPANGKTKRFIKVGGQWFNERSGEASGKPIDSTIALGAALERQLAKEHPQQTQPEAPKPTEPPTATPAQPSAAGPASELSPEVVAQHKAKYRGATYDFGFGDTQAGSPKALEALRSWPTDQLQKERSEMVKASFNQMFGHNAKGALNLIDKVLAERTQIEASDKGPGIIGMGGAIPAEFEAGPGQGGAGQDIYGIAERVRAERARAGQVAAVPRGVGISTPDSIVRGRELIANGANPEQIVANFEKTKRLSADDMAVARAYGERLAQAATRIESKFGTDSDEYSVAQKALSDWDTRTKPMQTEWNKMGMAQQGETDIDTGTYTGLWRAYHDATGKDFTPRQAVEAEKIAKTVRTTTATADTAKAEVFKKLDEETAKAPATAPKPGEQTPATLWKRARAMIDGGETDFDTLRYKLAEETGVPVKDVTRMLGEPKGARRVTDDMYRKMAARRRADQAARAWLKNQQMPGWLRFARAVPRAFFIDKIIGHGTVGMITHAGLNIFNPGAWRTYWPNFMRQYKLLGWHDQGAYHERAMQDLQRDPLFVTARRAGLANDPFRYTDDFNNAFANYFRKLGLTGNRGFDALKLFRQARFNQIWNRLPEHLQNPTYASMLADGLNHATGSVKMPFREWANWTFFAPKLEGSRWAWTLGDPLKAAKTFADWRTSSPEARAFAIGQLKEKAAIAGTYLGLLAVNQGLLSASGSKQKVNFTNPRRGDFLAFKAHGYNVGIVGPLLGMVRLFANLAHASMGKRTQLQKVSGTRFSEAGADVAQYLRGKASPLAGTVADVLSQADYQGRPLPFSKDRPPAYLRREGLGRYTYPEYLTEQFSPIPAEEVIKEVWRAQGLTEGKADAYLKALLAGVVIGGTGARVSQDLRAPKE